MVGEGVNSGKEVGLHLKRAADPRVCVPHGRAGRTGQPGPANTDSAVHEAKAEGGRGRKEGTVKTGKKGDQLEGKQAEAEKGVKDNGGRETGGLRNPSFLGREGGQGRRQS